MSFVKEQTIAERLARLPQIINLADAQEFMRELAGIGLVIVPLSPTSRMSAMGEATIMGELAKFPAMPQDDEILTPAERCWKAMMEVAPR